MRVLNPLRRRLNKLGFRLVVTAASFHLKSHILQHRLPFYLEHHWIPWFQSRKNLPQLLRVLQRSAVHSANGATSRKTRRDRRFSTEQPNHQDPAVGTEIQ